MAFFTHQDRAPYVRGSVFTDELPVPGALQAGPSRGPGTDAFNARFNPFSPASVFQPQTALPLAASALGFLGAGADGRRIDAAQDALRSGADRQLAELAQAGRLARAQEATTLADITAGSSRAATEMASGVVRSGNVNTAGGRAAVAGARHAGAVNRGRARAQFTALGADIARQRADVEKELGRLLAQLERERPTFTDRLGQGFTAGASVARLFATGGA
jgi:hypothetical protein